MPLPTEPPNAPINIIITGAAGFIGSLLATRLLQSPQYRLLLTDLNEPAIPAGVPYADHAAVLQGDITNRHFVTALLSHKDIRPLHAVFLLHGIMSAAAEADPDLSQRVNVDSIRQLAEAIPAIHPADLSPAKRPVRIIYTSSVAVFGPPFPPSHGPSSSSGSKVPEHWAPTPQSTYGAHKLLGEVCLNEEHRRGRLDVFALRLPTVAVRPGRPTGAASSFWSGIVREPMDGVECVVPVRDRGFRAFLSSPRTVVENLVRVLALESDVMPGHVRQLILPGISVSIHELRDALARYAGEDKLAFIREEQDERLVGILKSWAHDFDVRRPLRMGLAVDRSADDLVREYIEGLSQVTGS